MTILYIIFAILFLVIARAIVEAVDNRVAKKEVSKRDNDIKEATELASAVLNNTK